MLRRRGVEDPAASLAAEAGIAVFRIAFERWAHGTDDATLSTTISDIAVELTVVAAELRAPRLGDVEA